MGSWLDAVADLAPKLKEAELRVILELSRRHQMKTPEGRHISSRKLTIACKTERRAWSGHSTTSASATLPKPSATACICRGRNCPYGQAREAEYGGQVR